LALASALAALKKTNAIRGYDDKSVRLGAVSVQKKKANVRECLKTPGVHTTLTALFRMFSLFPDWEGKGNPQEE
jgi:hypothetical protein